MDWLTKHMMDADGAPVSCRCCGNVVSSSARRCPNCGDYDRERNGDRRARRAARGLVVVLVLIGIVWVASLIPDESGSATPDTAAARPASQQQ
jgi:hypothetical protein